MAIEYQVELRVQGQNATLYSGITLTEYSALSLNSNTTYEWRVRQIENASGIIYPSVWSSWVQFTTLVLANVEIPLGLASQTSTSSSLVPKNNFTPPVITLVGGTSYNTTVGTAWVEPGYSATDDEEGDVTGSVVIGGDTVDTTVQGHYDVTYTVSDNDGNEAVVTRTVAVAEVLTVTSYDLEWREQGGSFTQVNGIVPSEYTLTSLNPSTVHEWRVRGDASGQKGDWSSIDTFTTTTVAGDVTIALGSSVTTNNASGITPVVEGDLLIPLNTSSTVNSSSHITTSLGGDLLVALGGSTQTTTATTVTPNANNAVSISLGSTLVTTNASPINAVATSEVIVPIVASTQTGVARNIVPTSDEVVIIPAEKWDVEVLNTTNGVVTPYNDLTESQLTAALVTNNVFKFRVRGTAQARNVVSEWSPWSGNYFHRTYIPSIQSTYTDSGAIPSEALWVIAENHIGELNDFGTIVGEVSARDTEVTVTLLGETHKALLGDKLWVLKNPFNMILGGVMNYGETPIGIGIVDPMVDNTTAKAISIR